MNDAERRELAALRERDAARAQADALAEALGAARCRHGVSVALCAGGDRDACPLCRALASYREKRG